MPGYATIFEYMKTLVTINQTKEYQYSIFNLNMTNTTD